MKKFLICSLMPAFAFSAFGQVTVTGKGTPGQPYIIKWKVTSKDTVIASPTNTANKMAASIFYGLDKNYVFNWQVHYKGLASATAKVYPMHSVYPGDTLQTIMAIDTTTDGLLNSATGTGNFIFEGPYTSGTQHWFQFRKGSGTMNTGYVWIIQGFKQVQ